MSRGSERDDREPRLLDQVEFSMIERLIGLLRADGDPRWPHHRLLKRRVLGALVESARLSGDETMVRYCLADLEAMERG